MKNKNGGHCLRCTMGVSISQYRACIGMFNCLKCILCCGAHSASFWYIFRSHIKILLSVSRTYLNLMWSLFLYFMTQCMCIQTFYCIYAMLVLLTSWDIETNPGPVSTTQKSFSICNWNLNTVWLDNFIKLTLIEAYLSVSWTQPFQMMILCYIFIIVISRPRSRAWNLQYYAKLHGPS